MASPSEEDSSVENSIRSLANLFVLSSHFAKPSEIVSATKHVDSTKTDLETIAHVGNLIYPPQHDHPDLNHMPKHDLSASNRKEKYKLSHAVAKAWVDGSETQVPGKDVSYSHLKDQVEKVASSLYMTEPASVLDHTTCMIGAFWDFVHCPIRGNANLSTLVQSLRHGLKLIGYTGELHSHAVGDKRDFHKSDPDGGEARSKGTVSVLSSQSVVILDSPRELRDESKDVGQKAIINHMMAWMQRHAYLHKEAATILLISDDVDLRFPISSMISKGFRVLLAHSGNAHPDLIGAVDYAFELTNLIKM